jgi:hypothetical protein
VTLLVAARVVFAADLSGAVTDADGAPIEGAVVVAYDPRFAYTLALTDPTGAWSLAVPGDGPWRLRVLAPDAVDAQEAWYGTDQLDVCAAPALAASASGLDVALQRGVGLFGRLLMPDGAPLAGAEVAAWTVNTQLTDVRGAITDAAGRYSIVGLTTEEAPYLLHVSASGLPEQFVGGAYDEYEAPAFAPSSGAGAEVPDHRALPGITLAGRATGPAGPISGATLTAYSPSQVVATEIVDGAWRVGGLPPGDALVWVSGDGLATTYWPDWDRPTEYFSAPDEGGVYEDLDVVAPATSRMIGTVEGDGDLSRAAVLAYNDTGTVGIGNVVQADGSFEISGLHGGAYTLYVWAGENGRVDGFVEEGGERVVYDVPAEADTNEILVDLPLAVAFEGTVTDTATGRPVYGATVVAESASGDVVTGSADADGAYRIVGLPSGTWTLGVTYAPYCPADADWVDQWYPSARGSDGTTVLVLAGGVTQRWDPTLGQDNDHDAMDDAWEEASGLDPTVDDSALDPDGDGLTNLDEYLLDTDPYDAANGRSCGCATGGRPPFMALAAALWLTRRRRTEVT